VVSVHVVALAVNVWSYGLKIHITIVYGSLYFLLPMGNKSYNWPLRTGDAVYSVLDGTKTPILSTIVAGCLMQALILMGNYSAGWFLL
jgi:hypothetical protein